MQLHDCHTQLKKVMQLHLQRWVKDDVGNGQAYDCQEEQEIFNDGDKG